MRTFQKRGKLLTKTLMLQGYNESRLRPLFRKLYSRYNNLVCDYKLSLVHVSSPLLDCHFHTGLTTGNSVYLISTKGTWRVWPVSRGCLLLLGTRCYLCIWQGSVLPYTQFCNCLLDWDYVLHIANFAIVYLISTSEYLCVESGWYLRNLWFWWLTTGNEYCTCT
jgi:hypothetical protein